MFVAKFQATSCRLDLTIEILLFSHWKTMFLNEKPTLWLAINRLNCVDSNSPQLNYIFNAHERK